MVPQRYHKALVVLHWVLAVLLLVALAMGTFQLKTIPNTSPEKIFALRAHMIAGGLILVLMLVRLVVRLRTRHPAPATTGNPLLDRLAPVMHWAMYALVLVMAGSGVAMSVMAGLPAIVFGGSGTLPASFDALPPRAVHGLVAKLLLLAIALHVVAALFHHFIRRDGLLRRMGFGPR
jgi:cytochrome b561